MPHRRTRHGIEAEALTYNGGLIWLLTSPAGKEGIARRTDRNCWCHYADFDALLRNAPRRHACLLDHLMEGIADNLKDGISVAQIDEINRQFAEQRSAA